MNIITSLITSIFELVEKLLRFSFEFLEASYSAIPKRNEGYNAQFAPPSKILSKRESGFCLTGNRNISRQLAFQNAIAIGGTGSGKSSVILLPSLYTMSGSFIVHDPSGELHSKSSGYLNSKGYEVKVLNFSNPSVSVFYNPLARANTNSEIQKVASMLVFAGQDGKSTDPFWNTQAVALLTLLITILKTQEEECQNLYNVRHLLNEMGGNPKSVDALFSRYADPVTFSEYKSFIAYDEKIVSGVIASCKASLQTFADLAIALVTSKDTLDMAEFRSKPIALFIQNSIADQRYYSTLTSILFEQFFSYLLSRFPSKKEQDIYLLIDEASSLNLPTLPLAVANCRKHSSGILILLQDFNQLIHNYGKYNADAIRANCTTKMFFTGLSHEQTKELEATLGKFEYEDEKKHKAIRPLLTNDEIRTLKSNQALILSGNNNPMLVSLKPYYKKAEYRKYSEIPPVESMHHEMSDSIPLLILPEIKNAA